MLSPDLINSHYQVNYIGTKHLLVCYGIVFRDAAQLSLMIGLVRNLQHKVLLCIGLSGLYML